MEGSSTHVLYGHLDTHYVTITRGEGVFVYDQSGKKYLDAIGGVGVVNIGHGVKEIITAMSKQASTLAFSYGGLFDNEPRKELSQILQTWAPQGMGEIKTLFCSGGAEANEAALKIAYQYHWERGNLNKRKIIGRWQSYHGNTIGALSMSGRTSWRKMHSSLLLDFPHIPPPYCYRCPWGQTYTECGITCAYELSRIVKQEGPENIAAFIAEPIIGTSMSAVVPPPEYYPIIRQICDEFDILFIADEVMSGVGRTGRNWGIDHWQVIPDMITTAKGISSGYSPLAVLVVSQKVWDAIAQGSKNVMHSYTYGGNPISCATGVAVMRYIQEHNLVFQAFEMGEKLISKLQNEVGKLPYVGDVRGKGLFIGIELVADKDTKEPFPPEWNLTLRVEEDAMDNGLLVLGGVPGLIDGVAGDHIELVPPYIIEDEHIDFITDVLSKSLTTIFSDFPVI